MQLVCHFLSVPLTMLPAALSLYILSPAAAAAGSTPQRAITGLMIHCVADGLAMGAAALSGDLRLSMMIAVAM